MTELNQYKPDFVFPPGESLLDLLEERGISQADLARRTGFTTKHLNNLIKGKTVLMPSMALSLERVLGVPASFWNACEANYREFLARRDESARLLEDVGWLKLFPLREMVKWGYVERKKDKVEQLIELLEFFGFASPAQWEAWCSAQQPSFRISTKMTPDMPALSAWLRKGELIAGTIECEPYEEATFKQCVRSLRTLTLLEPEKIVQELEQRCATCGVAVVFLPALPRTSVHGATRWLSDDKALIQLSVRYKTDDHLWFAFFHEACHVLKHQKRKVYLQDGKFQEHDAFEEEANRFAADLLIPPDQYERLIRNPLTEAGIQEFAKSIGIAPGIVLGRLQHDGYIHFSAFHGLKQKYQFVNPTAK